MIPAGFLGSRADLLVDLALVVFVVLPALMPFVFRLARDGRHALHRNIQIALFATMTVAVLLLELDIRLVGGTTAFTAHANTLFASGARAFLLFHIAIAVVTWIGWVSLIVRSARRFRRPGAGETLPGSFSAVHRRVGIRVWLGLVATATTGTMLYIGTFVL